MLKNMDKPYDSPSKVVTLDLWTRYHGRLFPINIQYPHFFSVVQPPFGVRRSPRQHFLKQVYVSKDQKKYRILEMDLTSNKGNQRVEGIYIISSNISKASAFLHQDFTKTTNIQKNGSILKSGKSVHFAKVRQK